MPMIFRTILALAVALSFASGIASAQTPIPMMHPAAPAAAHSPAQTGSQKCKENHSCKKKEKKAAKAAGAPPNAMTAPHPMKTP